MSSTDETTQRLAGHPPAGKTLRSLTPYVPPTW